MTRGLVIGYGNVSRQDDGVAWHVINALARLMQRQPLSLDEDGFDSVGHELDMVLVQQLVPELSEFLAEYDLICFVDAHTGSHPEAQLWESLKSVETASAFTHHMTPSTLLLLSQVLYDKTPQGALLSLRGHQFGFGLDLSQETAQEVEPAAQRILRWMVKAGVSSVNGLAD